MQLGWAGAHEGEVTCSDLPGQTKKRVLYVPAPIPVSLVLNPFPPTAEQCLHISKRKHLALEVPHTVT